MKINLKCLSLFTILVVATGCSSLDPKRSPAQTKIHRDLENNTWHSVIIPIRTNRPSISLCNKLNPVWWLKNADSPVAPAWYRPNERMRNFKWHCRNPCHNFNSYVIGISDKEFVRAGLYPTEIWNPNSGWNYTVIKYKFVRLPMVSYRSKRINFYVGWRGRGDFGIKFIIRKKPEKI